jgi:hypothetical protein
MKKNILFDFFICFTVRLVSPILVETAAHWYSLEALKVSGENGFLIEMMASWLAPDGILCFYVSNDFLI